MVHQRISARRLATWISLLSLLAVGAFTHVDGAPDVSSLLKEFKLGEVIDTYYVTNSVQFKAIDNEVKPGDVVPVGKLHKISTERTTWVGQEGTLYTVIIVDLDYVKPSSGGPNGTATATNSAHQNPQQLPIPTPATIHNQYLAINVPHNYLSGGQTIVPYMPPQSPCPANHKHRMAILVFSQAQSMDIYDMAEYGKLKDINAKRQNFDLKNLVNRYQLQAIGATPFYTRGESQNGVCSSATAGGWRLVAPWAAFAIAATLMAAQALTSSSRHHRLIEN